MTTDRVELESKIAMLERMVEELSGELHAQGKSIEALQAQIKLLAEQLRSKQPDQSDFEPHDTPPPHYGG